MSIQEMIKALRASGLTQQQIADAIGASQPSVHRAEKGAEVLYVTGKAIEALYVQRCGPAVTNAA